MSGELAPTLIGEYLQNTVSTVSVHPPYGETFSTFFCSLWADQDEDVNWVSAQLEDREAPLLDVGCGDGRLSRKLVRANRDVTGIDVNSAMLDRAASLNRINQSRGFATPNYFLGDFVEFNWAKAGVGNVMCMGLTSAVIEVGALEKLFSLSSAHLPKGGLLLVDFLDRKAIRPGSTTTIPVLSKKAGDRVLYWVESSVDWSKSAQTTCVTRFERSPTSASATKIDSCRLVSRPIDLDYVLELARRYQFDCDFFRVSQGDDELSNRLVFARFERRGN